MSTSTVSLQPSAVSSTGTGARVGLHHHVAVHRDLRFGGKSPGALRVAVFDGLVHQLFARLLARMPDEKLQRGALGCPSRPGLEWSSGWCGHPASRRSRGWGREAGDDEIGIEHLVDDDVGGACLGDVGRQARQRGPPDPRRRALPPRGTRRVGGPFVQGVHIKPVRADQPDAIDDDALCAGRGGYGGGRRAGGGVPSVNITITLALPDMGSNSCVAFSNAAA